MTITPDPTVAWQPARFRATVLDTEADGPEPEGTVQFTESDGTPIGEPVPLDATGHADFDAAAGAGTYVVKALYSGDDLHAPSQTAASQHVTRQTTTTTIVSSVNPAGVGQPFEVATLVEADAPSEGVPYRCRSVHRRRGVLGAAGRAGRGRRGRRRADGADRPAAPSSAPATPATSDYLPSEDRLTETDRRRGRGNDRRTATPAHARRAARRPGYPEADRRFTSRGDQARSPSIADASEA